MKVGRMPVVVSACAVAILVAFFAGQWTAPVETWADQHLNRSRNPREFRNSFLGLTVRAPAEGEWWVLWKPRAADATKWDEAEHEFKMPALAGANKVLELERKLAPGGSDKAWARMDVFVEPLASSGQVGQELRKLEFREVRRGLRLESPQSVTIGGKPGSVRVGSWEVAKKKFRVVTYWVEHRRKLFVFSGVTADEFFERSLPLFNEIMASVRLR
jgi:hypothetical protein